MKNLHEERRHDMWIVIAIILLLLALSWALGTPVEAKTQKYITYTVQEGDTLWKIAKKYQPNRDPRAVIYEIEQVNGITPVIYPGQRFKVPVE